jgi:hypothetical protein
LAYQPFGGQITNADIAANAEIAVSKLQDGTARQLLQTAANGTDVEWASNIDIPGTLDVTGNAVFDANLTVQGDLTVNGTETIINTQTLTVEDKNIELGKITSPTDATADGGGITLKGTTDKTINWIDATDAWTLSEHVDLATGKEYRINGAQVLTGTALGSGVTGSSLTSVGTISSGTWQGTTVGTAYGGTGQTTYANGELLIGKTDGTLAKATLTAGTGVAVTNANGSITVAVDSTVVTTAQTGTVTSTMIADGTIVDADVNASAAIAGTKISPNFGSQNVVTTGTSTAASLIPTGSSVPTNGVYLPAANSVGISTNSVQRVFVDGNATVFRHSQSELGVGTGRPFVQLHGNLASSQFASYAAYNWVNGTQDAAFNLYKSRSGTIGTNAIVSNGDNLGRIGFHGDSGQGFVASASIASAVDGVPGQTAGTFVVSTEYRILTTGTTDFTLIGAADSNPGTIFTATDVGTGTGTAIRTAGDMPGRLVFSTTPDNTGAPVERLRITSTGQATFTTTGTTAAIFNTAANGFIRVTDGTIQTQLQNVGGAGKLRTVTDHPLAFDINSVERARIRADGMFEVKGAGTAGVSPAFSINGSAPSNSAVVDSSGRLGLGTSSPSQILHVKQDVLTGNNQSRIILENTDQRTVFGSYWQSGVGQYSIVQSTNAAETVPGVLLLNPSGGNVGIGTTSPEATLHLYDATAPSFRMGQASVTFNSYVDSGNYVAGTITNHPYVFTTNNTERARIDSSGKLLSPNGAAFFGTVTNSGNGAIMEHGSNANGQFVKYADGTQVCYLNRFDLGAGTTANREATWTLPASFANAEYVVHANLRAKTDGGGVPDVNIDAAPTIDQLMPGVYGSKSTTAVTIRFARVSGGTNFGADNILYAGVTAIGRWY